MTALEAAGGLTLAARISPLLARLRTATGAAHARIEALLRLDGPITLDRYRAVLRGFDVFLAAWEPQVLAALPQRLHAWFHARSRHAFLRQDLRDLNEDVHAVDGSNSRGPVSLGLSLDGPAAALGSMYVLEGSALGGQVIARTLLSQHGLGANHGARYFVGWGERTGILWREFRATMDAEVGDEARGSDRACAAAIATFEALIEVFEHQAPSAVADPSR